jgi:hypothetical protein
MRGNLDIALNDSENNNTQGRKEVYYTGINF